MRTAVAVLGLMMWAVMSAAGPASAPRAPVIVLVVADDLGWMDLGCQGNARIHTPVIDGLAAEGVRFTSAYAAAPVCSPTRAALMTGLAPARLGITQHGADGPRFWPDDRPVQPPATRDVLPLTQSTIAARLAAAGYATGFFGKWHLSGSDEPTDPAASGPAFWPEHHGFDVNVGGCGLGGPPTYFDPYRIPAVRPRRTGDYLCDRLADEAAAFLAARADRPVFLCLWTYAPHFPFEAPPDRVARYRWKEGPGLRHPVCAAQVESVDRAVGTVLAALERQGRARDALVIFTSDNGGWDEAADNRPLRSGKGDLYEGGLRVPLVVRWPRVVAAGAAVGPGAVSDVPVISMDVAATILDAAGIPAAADGPADGTSLVPLLQGEPRASGPLCFHYPHYAWHKANRPGGAIRDGRHKLIRRYDDDSVELYDLATDIGEAHDLATSQSALVTRLRGDLDRWLHKTGARLPEPPR